MRGGIKRSTNNGMSVDRQKPDIAVNEAASSQPRRPYLLTYTPNQLDTSKLNAQKDTSTEVAIEMPPVKIARRLFLSQADDEPYRPCYVVLAQAQKASHEVIALQSNGGSLIDLDIHASTRTHGKSEGRCGNAQVALARVNGAQLDVSERR